MSVPSPLIRTARLIAPHFKEALKNSILEFFRARAAKMPIFTALHVPQEPLNKIRGPSSLQHLSEIHHDQQLAVAIAYA